MWARTALPVSNVFVPKRPRGKPAHHLFISSLSNGDRQLCSLLLPSRCQSKPFPGSGVIADFKDIKEYRLSLFGSRGGAVGRWAA